VAAGSFLGFGPRFLGALEFGSDQASEPRVLENILSGEERASWVVAMWLVLASAVSGQLCSPLDLGSEWPQSGETRGVCWRLALMLWERKRRVEAVPAAAAE
jgi:hypothetical protein